MTTLRRVAILAAVGVVSLHAADPRLPPSLAEQQLKKLATIHTLYVEDLEGEGSHAIRDLLVAAIHSRGLFVIVENPATADAYVRGSAQDLIYTDYLRYREGINVRGATSSSRRESGESNFGSWLHHNLFVINRYFGTSALCTGAVPSDSLFGYLVSPHRTGDLGV